MNALTNKTLPLQTATTVSVAGPRRRARRALPWLGGVVALVLAAVAGNWWWMEARFVQSTDNAYVQGDIAVLGPRIDGDVIAIPVADNQHVRAGDPLIILDPADSQARLDQARGLEAEAMAAVATARSQIEQSRTAIAQTEAMIAQAEAEQTRAVAEAGRSGALATAGWTSRAANDTAVADRRKADAAIAASLAQRGNAQAALGVAQAQLGTAQAHLPTARAAVHLAENNLADTIIRAPFDGVVGNRAAQLGQHVNAALQLISVAPERTRLYVLANFKETQLARMQPGQKAILVPDIDSGAAVSGRVDSLAPATGALFSLLPPENATGNFTKVVQRVPVKIVIDAADAGRAAWLRPGLSVTAEVDTRGPDAVRLGLWGQLVARIGL